MSGTKTNKVALICTSLILMIMLIFSHLLSVSVNIDMRRATINELQECGNLRVIDANERLYDAKCPTTGK